jgi:hypothetical protein
VAHACNPSNQEDRNSKPVRENSSARPYLEKKNRPQKRTGGVAQVKNPEFNPISYIYIHIYIFPFEYTYSYRKMALILINIEK